MMVMAYSMITVTCCFIMLFYPLSLIYYISSSYLENVLHDGESGFYKDCKSNNAYFYSFAHHFSCFLLKMELFTYFERYIKWCYQKSQL
jgi:hypothetical protein